MKTFQRPIALQTIAIAISSAACGGAANVDRTTQGQAAELVTPPACRIAYSNIDWDGGGGFRADISLQNVGGSNYDGWSLSWKYAGDQSVTASWNGVVAQNGTDVTVTPGQWNRVVGPGENASITLLGTVSAPNVVPSSFAVNGVACADPASTASATSATNASAATTTAPSSTAPAAPAPAAPAPAAPAPAATPSSSPTPTAPAPAATSIAPAPAATSIAVSATRPFDASSPWNTPIAPSATVDPNSSALVSDLAASSPWPFFTINIASYSVPVYYADASTPMQTVTATVVGGQGFDSGQAQVPIPNGATPAVGTDQHLAVVNQATHQEWDMWSASDGSSGWTCAVCAMADMSGSGVRPPTQNPPWWMGHGARACGFPLTAGLITVDEMQQGSIEHALVIAYPHIRSRYYTPPASTAQVTTDGAQPDRGVPCGGRIQLDPSLNLDAMGLTPSGKILARALQKYGAFVGDYSGAVSLYADASPTAQSAWNQGLLSTYEIKDQIALSQFRVLSIGTLYDNGN